MHGSRRVNVPPHVTVGSRCVQLSPSNRRCARVAEVNEWDSEWLFAFNTIPPALLVEKLQVMQVDNSMIIGIADRSVLGRSF